MRSWRGFGVRLRGLALRVACAGYALAGCASDLGCDLDGTSRKLGGSGLLDCGLADLGDTSTVDACAVMAYNSRATFRAIYERSDGELDAIVYAAGGRYYALRASSDGDQVKRADCEGASIVTKGSREFVQCDKRGEFRKACE